jgi:hypothetical protein
MLRGDPSHVGEVGYCRQSVRPDVGKAVMARRHRHVEAAEG